MYGRNCFINRSCKIFVFMCAFVPRNKITLNFIASSCIGILVCSVVVTHAPLLRVSAELKCIHVQVQLSEVAIFIFCFGYCIRNSLGIIIRVGTYV